MACRIDGLEPYGLAFDRRGGGGTGRCPAQVRGNCHGLRILNSNKVRAPGVSVPSARYDSRRGGMKVAIIGSGNVGKALARSGIRAGHSIKLAASTPESAAVAAKATGAQPAHSSTEAVQDAELVIIAVPYDKLGEVFRGLGSAVDGKVVIDTTNHVNMQDPGAYLGEPSNAEEIQKRHPKVRVVKAFNYSFATRMADPAVAGTRLDGFVAGDDQGAKDKALEFVESIGYRPIDAGPLVMARALEGMAALIISLQVRHKWPWQNGWKLVGPPAD
ncbi:MAG: NADPH-dependent F420 reductase [Candidatus Dormibacteraceae bacterium]